MKTFNIKNTLNVALWTGIENKKSITRNVLSFAICLFIIMGCPTWFAFATNQDPQAAMEPSQAIITVLLFATMLVSPGAITHDMKKRQQLIDAFMLPASNLERFVGRCLYAIVYVVAMFVVTLIVADLAQMLVSLIFFGGKCASFLVAYFSMSQPITSMEGHWIYSSSANVAGWMIVWWIHTCYLVGAVLFRRNTEIYTTIAGIAFTLVVGGLITWGSLAMMGNGYMDQFVIYGPMAGTITSIVFGIAALFNYWLAYKLFTRIQIINNKWVNL